MMRNMVIRVALLIISLCIGNYTHMSAIQEELY